MTMAATAKKVTTALRKAGFPVTCYKGGGYVYFISDDAEVEIDSVYVCYLNQMSVEQYVDHVSGYFNKDR